MSWRGRVGQWLTRAGQALASTSTVATGPAYEGADQGRRTRGLYAPSSSVNAALAGGLETLRNRSHALMRGNPWAFNGLESFVANCIGTGVTPRSRASDLAFRAAVAALWEDWCEELDATGLCNGYGLQALVARTVFESGECFVRFRARRPDDGLAVPLQLQVLEPEHCPTWKTETLPGGGYIRNGVEFDPLGRRVAFWLYREHPGEELVVGNALDLTRVPASDVLHIFKPIRSGQVRGEPWLARVILRLHELDQYEDGELSRKKIESFFCGAVTTPDPSEPPQLGELSNEADGLGEMRIEPGSFPVLGPGEDIKFHSPTTSADFSPFAEHVLRSIAAGTGVTFEMLTGDLSKVNYSSIRAGTLEFRRRCEAFVHNTIVHQFCRPLWARFIDTAILAGALKAPGYAKQRRDYLRALWVPQGWQWVDPAKEVAAKQQEILAGLTSRTQAILERGDDPERIDEEIAEDNARADAHGLKFTSDGRQAAAAATAPATEPDDDDAGDAPAEDAPAAPARRAGGRY